MNLGSSEQGAAPPHTYRTEIPQRYSVNYHCYLGRKGLVRPEDSRTFTAYGYKHDLVRFYFFCLIFDQLCKEEIAGDFAELGVYKGNTASLLANFARKLGRTAYLLDTFDGFPEKDLVAIDADKATQFSDTSIEAVRNLVGDDNVKFVKGYFPDTQSELPADGAYSFVHLDCDLYAPMKSALEYFWPRVSPGGFLVLHDYSSLHWNGAETAIDEYFADLPECVVPMPDASGSVVVRKLRSKGAQEPNWIERRAMEQLARGWIEPSRDSLQYFAKGGWSGIEPWGIWGVGPEHRLELPASASPEKSTFVDFDVKVLLHRHLRHQTVDVFVDATKVGEWHFSRRASSGIRTIELPAMSTSSRVREIVLRPASTVCPRDQFPGNTDGRQLGVGLQRFRVRSADAGDAVLRSSVFSDARSIFDFVRGILRIP